MWWNCEQSNEDLGLQILLREVIKKRKVSLTSLKAPGILHSCNNLSSLAQWPKIELE